MSQHGRSPSSADFLDALRRKHPKAIDLSLDRLEALLARVGHPERRLPPVIHVAGTNGKGSTIAFMRAGLEAAGCSVHVYTSPHLVSFHERIRLGGRLIDEPTLAALLAEVLAAIGDESITFFEATTCAALLAFSRVPADYTLLEVGMGGRLDATNVAGLAPVACVITAVSLDHQEFLGSTVEAIAAEKAGILRAGVPAVVAPQTPGAFSVIRARAATLGCPLAVCGDQWDACEEGERLHFRSFGARHGARTSNGAHTKLPEADELLPLPSLVGSHQVENAGVALAVLLLLGHGQPAVLRGAVAGATWPARLQRLTRGPLASAAGAHAELWLDGGHNLAGGVALAAALSRLGQERQPTVFVCAMLRTKDVRGFLAPLRALGATLFAVPIPNEATLALTAAETAAAAAAVGFEASEIASPLAAVERAVATHLGHRILARRDTMRTSGPGADPKAPNSAPLPSTQLEDNWGCALPRPGADPQSGRAPPLRIVICGSLYLAGWVLQENGSPESDELSGGAALTSRL